jgi:hypothetical protein
MVIREIGVMGRKNQSGLEVPIAAGSPEPIS